MGSSGYEGSEPYATRSVVPAHRAKKLAFVTAKMPFPHSFLPFGGRHYDVGPIGVRSTLSTRRPHYHHMEEHNVRLARFVTVVGVVIAATATGVTAAQAAQPDSPGAADGPGAHASTVPARIVPNAARQHSSRAGGRGVTAANASTLNWAGYVASGGTYTSVSSTWTQPAVLCSSKGIVSFWVGLDGWGDGTVEQDGTGVDCRSGSPQYYAWWEIYPTNSQQTYSGVTVAPNDVMTSTVSFANGSYTLVLSDTTQGWSRTTTAAAPSGAKNVSAEVIAEAATINNAVSALPNFGQAAFSSTTVNGGSLQDAAAQSVDMTNSNGSVIASTGATDAAGGAFAVTYTGGSNVHAAFQSDTGSLYTYSATGNANANAAVMAGTSPAITTAPGGYEVAYQDTNGQLVLTGTGGSFAPGLAMMAGTSPSIAALSGGGFEVAYQSDKGFLALYSSASGPASIVGLGMYAGTSPAISATANNGYQVVFQANTGNLWRYMSGGRAFDMLLGMMAGTDPSIATLANGTIEIVFQANTGYLWTTSGTQGVGASTGLGMASGTSPAIAASASGDYKVAFQANTGVLWTYASSGSFANQNQPMMAGTDPDITAVSGGYETAIQNAQGDFAVFGEAGKVDTRQGMLNGTSPTIAA